MPGLPPTTRTAQTPTVTPIGAALHLFLEQLPTIQYGSTKK